jgi:predicted nucleic acid-binding protein
MTMTLDDSGPLVVDTDVVSYLFRGDTRAQLYRSMFAGRVLIVSFMTVAELERWALGRDWSPARRASLERFLERFTLLPFDWPLCRRWAEAVDGARRRGRPFQTADAWVAATALHLDIPLVTHNPSDYAGVPGLTVLSG